MRLAALLLALVAAPLFAQPANVARGFDPGKAYTIGDIDSVNIFNGNLVITIPIGPSYPVSEALSYQLQLAYNGNSWDYVSYLGGELGIPARSNNAGLGWQLSIGGVVSGPALPENAAAAWAYTTADGATRTFYPSLHQEESNNSTYSGPESPTAQVAAGGVIGYTRDGTYLRLIRMAPEIVFESTDPETGFPIRDWQARRRVELPDGTVHILAAVELIQTTGPATLTYQQEIGQQYRVERMEDRFGNSVDVAYDTLPNGNEMWTITDSTGRFHTVTFERFANAYKHGTDQWRYLAKTVSLTRVCISLRMKVPEARATNRNIKNAFRVKVARMRRRMRRVGRKVSAHT